MDQIKIGKYISECRKKKGIYQSDLAEHLGITNRAVSKWENGICMPDAGTIPELCDYLGISINDLFSGEDVDNMESDELVLELVRDKEKNDKQLLILEVVIGIQSSVILTSLILFSALVPMHDVIKISLIVLAILLFAIGIYFALKIEKIAGFYECGRCHYKYVPKYTQVLFSMHALRTRYIKCPKCGKSSWNKKVISK